MCFGDAIPWVHIAAGGFLTQNILVTQCVRAYIWFSEHSGKQESTIEKSPSIEEKSPSLEDEMRSTDLPTFECRVSGRLYHGFIL